MRPLVKLFLSVYSQPQSLPDSRAGTFTYLPEPQFPQLWSPESHGLGSVPSHPPVPSRAFPLQGLACSSRTQSPGLQFPMGRLTFAYFLTYNTAWARGPDTRDKQTIPVHQKGQQGSPGLSVTCVFSQVRYSGCHSCPLPERVVVVFSVTEQELGQEAWSGPQSSVSLRLFSFFCFPPLGGIWLPVSDLFTY